ncbi:MAG: hypothetical protein ACI93H_001453, partial [Psychromonas sp.]
KLFKRNYFFLAALSALTFSITPSATLFGQGI